MPYSEILIKPMREDLTRFGIEETRTPEQVDAAIKRDGTTLMVVNSVCGCAAGKARPGVVMALQQASAKPDRAVTVFAGADIDATERAREFMKPYPPSSPSIALFKDGKLVFMMERHQIETSDPYTIAENLRTALDKFCASTAATA
jgi:putative YphP/YqiW family bacilliredoxin